MSKATYPSSLKQRICQAISCRFPVNAMSSTFQTASPTSIAPICRPRLPPDRWRADRLGGDSAGAGYGRRPAARRCHPVAGRFATGCGAGPARPSASRRMSITTKKTFRVCWRSWTRPCTRHRGGMVKPCNFEATVLQASHRGHEPLVYPVSDTKGAWNL